MKSQDDIKMPVFPHGKTGTHIKYYNCQPFLTKKPTQIQIMFISFNLIFSKFCTLFGSGLCHRLLDGLGNNLLCLALDNDATVLVVVLERLNGVTLAVGDDA